MLRWCGCLLILHKVAALCHTSLSGSGPQYLSDLTHVYTPARSLHSSSDTNILSIPNVKFKSYQRSLPTLVPMPEICYHFHSNINRNLTASSKLWKLIYFLSINELNTSVVFCYFHLPTVNTTLVINKLRHYLTIDINLITIILSLCFCILLVWHIGGCPTELSRNVLPFYCIFILFFMFQVYVIMYLYCDCHLFNNIMSIKIVKRLELF